MTGPATKRLDLGAWLADLRRVGGQARTIAERIETLDGVMSLADLEMLQEATKRLILSLNKGLLYGLSGSHTAEVGTLAPDHAPSRHALAATPPIGSTGVEDAGFSPGSIARRDGGPMRGIIGDTEAMRRVHVLIGKAAACSLPVLIHGESGTGKELVARAIHERSDRRHRRFFSENCSALSEGLLESELFGHVRGAFTGADRDRKGILELAHGGTLFLDEIGDMSLRMQSKLLRALQEREIRPVGGKEPIRIDVRVMSATHRNLQSLIREGAFREDLFYRINVIAINLPPLRQRRQDIPSLVAHFLDGIAVGTGFARKECSTGALELLVAYEWPGNIRELENVVQRAVALGEGGRIDAADLPDRIRHVMITEDSSHYTAEGKPGEQLLIEKALHNFDGDKTRAAQFIGWSRPKLYRRMRAHGVANDFGRPGGSRLRLRDADPAPDH